MNTVSATGLGPVPATPPVATRQMDAAHQAYVILHWGFTVLPIIAGADKFFHRLTNWDTYLAPAVASLAVKAGLTIQMFMQAAGVVEIVAGLIVAFKPKFGAYLVAVWLAAIIVNLLLLPGYYDIALRDFGLFLAAVALGRLSQGQRPWHP